MALQEKVCLVDFAGEAREAEYTLHNAKMVLGCSGQQETTLPKLVWRSCGVPFWLYQRDLLRIHAYGSDNANRRFAA